MNQWIGLLATCLVIGTPIGFAYVAIRSRRAREQQVSED